MRTSTGLRTKGALIAVLLATASLMIPATSPAVVGSGCGGTTFSGGFHSCTFAPVGLSFEVLGETDSFDFVQVYVTDALGGYRAYCNGYGSCHAYVRPVGIGNFVGHPLADAGPFVCHFQSNSAGTYQCINNVA